MFKNLFSISLVSLLLLSMTSQTIFANQVIDEKWGVPTFVYGSGLNQSQLNETKNILNIKDKETIDLKITGKEMVRLLGSGNPNANMYSSALIQGNDLKGGIVVTIETPENITKVTQNQYANALITAGAKDVNVIVASPVKVTGESALTGVYLAYEDKGYILDETAMNIAQDELEVVSSISKELESKEDFNSELLDMALIEIKQQLAEVKEANGELTKEVAQEVVNNALQEYQLSDIISDVQVEALVALAVSYEALDSLFTPEMQEQLNQLATDVTDKAKDIFNGISNTLQDEGFWDKVKNFFATIIDWISNLFISNEETTV